ncbi:MAG: hypothetical protein DAHOPDDO_00086 [Ignavibacteriaceae bacterium]|nr:hypothetical protein [Ignavibacteriaceae bacterium]
MKNSLLLFTVSFLLYINVADAQPNLPDSSHVLVVYKVPTSPTDTLGMLSDSVMQYYVSARGIPITNIVPLNQIQDSVIINYGGEDHLIVLDQQKEIIKDVNNATTDYATKHAWIYFNERIAKPIAQHLKTTIVNGDTLKNIIRFIVLCKGIPFRINPRWGNTGFSRNTNVSVDRLLCFVGETIYDEDALINKYFYFNPKDWWQEGYQLQNPYYNVDPNFSMNHNFVPNHYKGTYTIDTLGGETRNVTLSYLVSHLDAPFLDTVKSMIDRSIAAINSSSFDWFIDSDPVACLGTGFLKAYNTKNVFDVLGITNYFIDDSETIYTSYNNKPIMSYSSNGTWTTDGPYSWPNCQNFAFDSNYIQSQLSFAYAPGAIFNTAESFNGNTLGTWPIIRRENNLQGQIAEFIFKGGTVGVGQAEHGTYGGGGRIIDNSIMLPSYAMGYTFIEAAYMGMSHLTDERVFIGDPLTRIAYPCEPTILTSNTTISSGNYDCDVIVPSGVTLTISDSSIVNFNRNAQLIVNGILNIETDAEINFNGFSQLNLENSSQINFANGTVLNFNNRSKFNLKQNLTISAENSINFYSTSEFIVEGNLTMGLNSSMNFNNSAIIKVMSTLTLNPGTVFTFNNSSRMWIFGKIYCLGESNNKVTLNFSNSTQQQFLLEDSEALYLNNTVINKGDIEYSLSSDQVPVEILSITNTTFNNTNQRASIKLNLQSTVIVQVPIISNCSFNNGSTISLELSRVHSIDLENITFNLTNTANCIRLLNCGVVNISNCIFTSGFKGVSSLPSLAAENIEFDEDLIPNLNVNQCVFSTTTGIELGRAVNEAYATINGNHFYNCTTGILAAAFFEYTPIITNNIISGQINIEQLPSQSGITLSAGNEILVSNNSITNFLTGISIFNVSKPLIKENFISAVDLQIEPLSGIIEVSSGGEIRKNTIQYHKTGIELGSASPKIGANIITNNDEYGIYISNNSKPDLSESFIGEEQYPLSGYNTIRENGLCNQMTYSELYLIKSMVNLEKGCNTIADDRQEQLGCGYYYLIDGEGVDGEIMAVHNYWGELNGSNPEGRFGEQININYDDWLEDACTYGEAGMELVLNDSRGVAYDTIYSTGNTASGLSDIKTRYATANNYYYHNQYTQAKQEYEVIIQNYGNNKESIQAYNQLYAIANLTNSSPADFNQLKDFYLQKASNQTDSIMIGTLTHLSDLCLVSAGEYLPAINNFDINAQQNPNTDIALYRQIDALTTALLLPQDSTLNKGVLGKYSVNNLSEYTNKLNELLSSRGKSGFEDEQELLPTEFTLYQNYPNPFNPTTTIKYDIPASLNPSKGETLVNLAIYDILGRRVKVLVNEIQQAGRYEVQFDASNLSSGVYIYQLITEKYLSSKKMILLR